jgi:hypothetical protein
VGVCHYLGLRAFSFSGIYLWFANVSWQAYHGQINRDVRIEIKQMKIKTIILLWCFLLFSLCYSNENREINGNQNNNKSNQIINQNNKDIITINQKENVNQVKAIDTMAFEPDKNANHNKIVIGILCGVAAVLLVIGLIYAKKSLDKSFDWNIR